MQYMLLIYTNEQEVANLPEDQLKAMYAAYGTFTQELIDSGAMRGGSELAPVATATTVRVRNGKVLTTDGPFAETREQLGGYYLIEVDNLDQALNPRLITRLTGKLSGWLKSAGVDRQLLFTAHNPAVLDGLDLTDDEVRLFAVERNSSGHTCVRRIMLSENLRTLHEQYPLSRLWLMGNLGAVPSV